MCGRCIKWMTQQCPVEGWGFKPYAQMPACSQFEADKKPDSKP